MRTAGPSRVSAVILIVTVSRVILYSRPGCRLCDDAKRAFLAAMPDAEIEEVDVGSDPALEELYGLHIPVALAAGRELFRNRFDPACIRLIRESRDGRP
ncbi:MAG: glutaredoxin family protein [Bryobacterales bacterium]|nr:glutaredoxin family protein [Bryobacterales bacterium]MDE0629034.1 glutaredoxin family protein [Bryobacterales bacterium]